MPSPKQRKLSLKRKRKQKRKERGFVRVRKHGGGRRKKIKRQSMDHFLESLKSDLFNRMAVYLEIPKGPERDSLRNKINNIIDSRIEARFGLRGYVRLCDRIIERKVVLPEEKLRLLIEELSKKEKELAACQTLFGKKCTSLHARKGKTVKQEAALQNLLHVFNGRVTKYLGLSTMTSLSLEGKLS